MKTKLRVCSLVMAAFSSQIALGQGGEEGKLEEVLVTAQKRSESLQDVPIAITAMSSKDMENREAFNFADVAASVPTITLAPYPSSSDALILFIRGQGANDVAQITKEGAVGMYIDGVYLSRPQSVSMDLADVEQVEDPRNIGVEAIVTRAREDRAPIDGVRDRVPGIRIELAVADGPTAGNPAQLGPHLLLEGGAGPGHCNRVDGLQVTAKVGLQRLQRQTGLLVGRVCGSALFRAFPDQLVQAAVGIAADRQHPYR